MQKKLKETKQILFHTLTEKEAFEHLQTNPDGLSGGEVVRRFASFGKNELDEGKPKSLISKFIDQFKNIMVIILLVAAAISGFMEELTDTFIILAVVVINAILGVVQESKAEKALAALKKMSSPFAKVKRNGQVNMVSVKELTVGDVVILEAGDFVPADMRLIEAVNLKVEEAPLTGESVPSEKITSKIDNAEIVIGDRKNMAYAGCSVVYGRGSGVVTAIGMDTEVGKIAGYLSKDDAQETPLQRKLSEMSKFLSIGIIAVSIIVYFAGVLQGRDYLEMFLTAVSLAVAAIPEGLPAVITIVLAMGVQKMASKNAIIRKLSAVETLGCTQIICSDKTGTLTQNKMTVKEVYANEKFFDLEADKDDKELDMLHNVLVLCNDSKVVTEDNKVDYLGDPTETALVRFAHNKGKYKKELDVQYPRVGEVPFDSSRKLMSTVNEIEGKTYVFTKGAPDILLDRCSSIYLNGEIKALTGSLAEKIKAANSKMALKALRVLAAAYKPLNSSINGNISEEMEQELIFVGLVGMIDPPRPEAREAVGVCVRAGIKPVMITGDHRDTATAIAKELNIIDSDQEVITGVELDSISEAEFEKRVSSYSVYARVSPEHKVRIVKAWKNNGKIVAMTGDGVNDAPALKASDIGIGMGITGTDVAKGVSNMVLADDNFATIVNAVEEGRKIYSNIRKTIQFLLSSNLGEVVTLFIATMLNWTVLLPIHILWVNLVTDTLPALALGMEKAENDVMLQKPRKEKDSFFSDGVGVSIIYQGITKGLITLLTYFIGISLYTHEVATTMAFATLGLIQLAHCLNVRSNDKSLLKLGLFTNMYLIGAIVISAVLQLIIIFVPFLNSIFEVTTLSLNQWLIVLAASISIIPIVEVMKIIMSRQKTNKRNSHTVKA